LGKKLGILFVLMCIGFTLSAQERLDNFFGFREFKLKTAKEDYARYELKRTDFYNLPNIIEVYALPYSIAIGNTRMEELHLFFLGNRLVRVVALLKDSLNLGYLKKTFGEGIPPTGTSHVKEVRKEEFAKSGKTYFYSPVYGWQAESVCFEEKWMYYMPDKKSVTKKMCLDLYLKDFKDMMQALTN